MGRARLARLFETRQELARRFHVGDDDSGNRYLVEDRSGKHVVLCEVPPLIAK